MYSHTKASLVCPLDAKQHTHCALVTHSIKPYESLTRKTVTREALPD